MRGTLSARVASMWDLIDRATSFLICIGAAFFPFALFYILAPIAFR